VLITLARLPGIFTRKDMKLCENLSLQSPSVVAASESLKSTGIGLFRVWPQRCKILADRPPIELGSVLRLIARRPHTTLSPREFALLRVVLEINGEEFVTKSERPYSKQRNWTVIQDGGDSSSRSPSGSREVSLAVV
jgi:hypothetical protein